MQGAPQLANAWGDMTALLDAVLVDGFNLRTVDSLTFADGIATARVNAVHLYLVDQVVTIAGANQPEYNGEARRASFSLASQQHNRARKPVEPSLPLRGGELPIASAGTSQAPSAAVDNSCHDF